MRYGRLLALVTLALLAACANEDLGQDTPVCQPNPDEVIFTTGLIIQMQAVPEAAFVPCVESLKTGWEYEHVTAERGESRFWLSSDRTGTNFVEVSLSAACAPSPEAVPIIFQRGIDTYADVRVTPAEVTPVIVPVTGREMNYALLVKRVLDEERFNGRDALTAFDRRDLPLVDKVADAHANGSPVVVIDEQNVLSGTASLILVGELEGRRDLTIVELIDRLDGGVPEASYRGTWYHLFDGGCATFEFDARGPEVTTLENDMRAALGFVNANLARNILRDAGILE